MSWTALVPIKSTPLRKSRLAVSLSPSERAELSGAMLEHVVDRLHACKSIGQVLLLSPSPIGSHQWTQDWGQGLNRELARAQFATGSDPLLVIHADLPLLTADDVSALLEAALREGQAIAPDRHLVGTNAMAIADGAIVNWSFGASSFTQHRAVLRTGHAVVERPGLLLDCDTRADLLIAETGGFVWRETDRHRGSAFPDQER